MVLFGFGLVGVGFARRGRAVEQNHYEAQIAAAFGPPFSYSVRNYELSPGSAAAAQLTCRIRPHAPNSARQRL